MAFSYYKSATLSEAQSGTADSTDWPLAICLDGNVQAADADLKTVGNGGFVQNANGYDIRPYADSALTSPLTYELVYYQATTGKLEMHVKIPTLSASTDTVIYLAFGDSGISTDGSSTSTWVSDFVHVYHFPDGSTLSMSDSSQQGNNLTNNGLTATAGKADGGANGDGSADYAIKSSYTGNLNGTSNASQSIWFKTSNNSQPNDYPVSLPGNSGGGQNGFDLSFQGTSAPEANIVTSGGFLFNAISKTYGDGNWHHFGHTYDGSLHKTFWDGVEELSQSLSGTLSMGANEINIGRFGSFGGGVGLGLFEGDMDEARTSAATWSPSWITADYNSQKDSSTFITWGTKVPVGGGAVSHRLPLMGVGQ